MAAGDLDDPDLIAERALVRPELVLAHEPELSRVHQQRGDVNGLRRRRRSAQLGIHRHDSGLAVPEPELAVRMPNEMFAVLLLEVLARRREEGLEPFGDRVLGRVVRAVRALSLGEVEADVREKLDRGIEQHHAPDPFGCEHRELE